MQEKKYKRCIVLFAVLIALTGAALHIYYCPGLARAAVRTKSLKIKGQDKGYLIDKKEKKKLRLQVKPSGVSGKKIKWKSSKKISGLSDAKRRDKRKKVWDGIYYGEGSGWIS